MATITGITAERAQQILNQTIQSITLEGGVFTATLKDGVTKIPIGNFDDAITDKVEEVVDTVTDEKVPDAVAGQFFNKGSALATTAFTGLTSTNIVNALIKGTLTANMTLNVANLPSGCRPGTQFSMVVIQDATGGRTITLTGIKKSRGSLLLTPTAAAVDIIVFMYDGATWYAGLMGSQFS